jgi:hypothetical protein
VHRDPVQALRLQLPQECRGDLVGQIGELDLTGVVGERDVEDPELGDVDADCLGALLV